MQRLSPEGGRINNSTPSGVAVATCDFCRDKGGCILCYPGSWRFISTWPDPVNAKLDELFETHLHPLFLSPFPRDTQTQWDGAAWAGRAKAAYQSFGAKLEKLIHSSTTATGCVQRIHRASLQTKPRQRPTKNFRLVGAGQPAGRSICRTESNTTACSTKKSDARQPEAIASEQPPNNILLRYACPPD